MRLDPALMEVIVCPACHGSLDARESVGGTESGSGSGPGSGELVCVACGRAYPVRDGIPVLLVDHARQV